MFLLGRELKRVVVGRRDFATGLNSTSLNLFIGLLSIPLLSNPYFYLGEYHKKPISLAAVLNSICRSPNPARYNTTVLKCFCC